MVLDELVQYTRISSACRFKQCRVSKFPSHRQTDKVHTVAAAVVFVLAFIERTRHAIVNPLRLEQRAQRGGAKRTLAVSTIDLSEAQKASMFPGQKPSQVDLKGDLVDKTPSNWIVRWGHGRGRMAMDVGIELKYKASCRQFGLLSCPVECDAQ